MVILQKSSYVIPYAVTPDSPSHVGGNVEARERRLRTLLRRIPLHTSAVTSRQGNGGSEPCYVGHLSTRHSGAINIEPG